MPGRRIILELAVATLDDALLAKASGADRIELNSALALGGLTPSPGLLPEVKRRVDLPIMVMVRPRCGGFCYSEAEFDVLCRDVEWAVQAGADGIVYGILQADGTIDVERCAKVRQLIADRVPSIFHRAFDLVPDQFRALQQLIDLGFRRVMTSGQQSTAYNGIWRIASLIDEADGRIEILPAGGINRHNVLDIVSRTGSGQIHCGLRRWKSDPSASLHPQVSFGSVFGGDESRYDATDATAVEHLRRLLDSLA
jgi:copper homeostasis protein